MDYKQAQQELKAIRQALAIVDKMRSANPSDIELWDKQRKLRNKLELQREVTQEAFGNYIDNFKSGLGELLNVDINMELMDDDSHLENEVYNLTLQQCTTQ